MAIPRKKEHPLTRCDPAEGMSTTSSRNRPKSKFLSAPLLSVRASVLTVSVVFLFASTSSGGQKRSSRAGRSVGEARVRVSVPPVPSPPPAPVRTSPRSLERYRGNLEGFNEKLEQHRKEIEDLRGKGSVDLPTYRENMNQYHEGIQHYQGGIKTYKESTKSGAGGAATAYRLDPKVSESRAAAVANRMATVQKQALTKVTQLQPVSPPPSASVTGTVYDYRHVQSALTDAKRRTLAELHGPDLEPLRLYVEKKFPTGEQLPVQRYEWNRSGVVSADSVRAASGDVNRLYESLKTLKGIAVDLKIASQPTEASVTVAAITKRLSATTDSTLSLFRGLYSYTVVKPGFKTVTGELDLVNDSRGLECTLHQDVGPDGPTPCNRR